MRPVWAILFVTVIITATVSALYVAYLAPVIQAAQSGSGPESQFAFTFLEVFVTGLGAAIATSAVVATVMARKGRGQKGGN